MVESIEVGEETTKSRLGRWAVTLREAFFNRSPYRGHRRCLDANDLLKKIGARIAHENKIRPLSSRTNRRRRPWDPRTDISDVLAVEFPEESSIGKLLRAHIYNNAEVGELTPTEAEHWAKVFKWRPFAALADEVLYDPNEVELWSLGMAIKWVECVQFVPPKSCSSESLSQAEWLENTLHEVRQECPTYIEQSLRWVKNGEGGHSLCPMTYRGCKLVDADAKQLLCNAFYRGKVKAVGIKSGVKSPISSQSWATLRIVGRKNRDGADRVVDATTVTLQACGKHNQLYDSVYVDQRSLRLAFPAPLRVAEIQKGISRAELIRTLKDMSAQQSGKRVSQRAAQDLLSKLKLTISREILRQVISELWPAPRGRPRKSAD